MAFIKEFSWDGLEDSDGSINTNHIVFQQGRHLYEAEVIVAKLDKGETISPEDVRDLAIEFCRLVNGMGQLRAAYASLKEEKKTMREKITDFLRRLVK
jgi:hypothetical protein